MEIPLKRRRNAAATREAILQSAVVAFTRSGYDGVGVREIAEAAGVTAMLVNRYFGSKEQLFAEVVDVSFAPRTVVGSDVATLAHDVAAALVGKTASEAAHLDPFLLMLRSASNPRAAEITRAGIERHVGRHLTDLLPGEEAGERAELFLALISGFWLMRKVLGTTALSAADAASLAQRLEAVFELLVD
ncbi:MAG: TetR family transcriptional regulator [Amycolatopsis sp.]|jgi:AcrR family transcriptional regulator|uniref:TetR/AcrR family transcriptional regulator n=1 Tax=Amycolatopsis sp. TaxID=37632 RepID=UPI002618DF06|nr:TetR/AcrR family transcriptional regulator [Amycolatopsis sp.]MCU1681757.1 TetR family transcriptional regulator [Amycolatopsis sp.]